MKKDVIDAVVAEPVTPFQIVRRLLGIGLEVLLDVKSPELIELEVTTTVDGATHVLYVTDERVILARLDGEARDLGPHASGRPDHEFFAVFSIDGIHRFGVWWRQSHHLGLPVFLKRKR